MYTTDLAGTRHSFANLRDLLAAASPARSGDALAGIGADRRQPRYRRLCRDRASHGGGFREWLLSNKTDGASLARIQTSGATGIALKDREGDNLLPAAESGRLGQAAQAR